MYDELGADARAAGVHLVPVRLITMRGSHRVGADVTSLNAGILMPAYPVTLALVPRALLLSHGAYMLELLQAAVDFLFARGWVHGDVKPSNIFLSGVDGLPWLGDFGSSVRTAEVRAGFQGGTPHFMKKFSDDASIHLAKLGKKTMPAGSRRLKRMNTWVRQVRSGRPVGVRLSGRGTRSGPGCSMP